MKISSSTGRPPPANRFLKWMSGWIGDISPTCKQATRLQSQALDGKLSARQRFGLYAHRCLCKSCRHYGWQIGFIRETFHKCDEQSAKSSLPSLSPAARERILNELKK